MVIGSNVWEALWRKGLRTPPMVTSGISDIAGGDESSFNLRLGGIQQSVKDQMFSSVQTQLAGFVGIQLSARLS